jgi:hypothetical protein
MPVLGDENCHGLGKREGEEGQRKGKKGVG